MEKPKFKRGEIELNSMSPEEQKQHLANFSGAEQMDAFIKNVDQSKVGIMLPSLPKSGEMISCQLCGESMPPSSFSKNASVRKREFKWHIHEVCMNGMFDLADRSTTGLMAERGRK